MDNLIETLHKLQPIKPDKRFPLWKTLVIGAALAIGVGLAFTYIVTVKEPIKKIKSTG